MCYLESYALPISAKTLAETGIGIIAKEVPEEINKRG